MQKIYSVIIILVFVNFMALPSLAYIFDFEIHATSNVMIVEEENHSSSISLVEKTVPKVLSVHDFLKFFAMDSNAKPSFSYNPSHWLSPELTIFSPPPEA